MTFLRRTSGIFCLALLTGVVFVRAAPLHEAARAGDKAKIEALLAEGADLNAKDENDYLPLHSAVDSAKQDVVALLLAKGAEVDGRGVYSNEMTPLHLAADRGLRDIAELLLANGADINAKKANRSTPLALAVNMERMDVIPLLLASGADVYAPDTLGRSILAEAMSHNDAGENRRKILELLLAQGDVVDGRTVDGQTALHLAAFYGKRKLAELSLAKGIDINTRDNEGLTPLHNAAIHGTTEIIELLLAHGATLEPENNDGRTPLDYAALWGNQVNFALLRAKLAALPLSADAETVIEQGIAAAKKPDYPEAIRLFEFARAEAPYSPLPLYYLGLAESKIAGRELRALCWFKAFLAASPDSPKAEAVSAEIAHLEQRSREILLALIKGVTTAADLLPEPPANEPQNPDGSPHDFTLKSVALLWARAGDADAALARANRITHPLVRTLTVIEMARPLALAGDVERGQRVIATAVTAIERLERSDDRDLALRQAAAALADLADGPGAHVIAAKITDAHFRYQAEVAIARSQALAGNFAAATTTAEAIPVRFYRSAAQAFLARSAAESGDRTTAALLLDSSRASLAGVAYEQKSIYHFGFQAAAVVAGRGYNWDALKRGVLWREYDARPAPVPPKTVDEADQQSCDVRFLHIDRYIAEGLIREPNRDATHSYLKAGQTQAVRDLGIALARLGHLKEAEVIFELRRESELNDQIDGRWVAEMQVGLARGYALAGDPTKARMQLVAARSLAKPEEFRVIDETANGWIAANEYLLNDAVFTGLHEHLKGLPKVNPQHTFSVLADTVLTLADAQAIILAPRSRPLNP